MRGGGLDVCADAGWQLSQMQGVGVRVMMAKYRTGDVDAHDFPPLHRRENGAKVETNSTFGFSSQLCTGKYRVH